MPPFAYTDDTHVVIVIKVARLNCGKGLLVHNYASVQVFPLNVEGKRSPLQFNEVIELAYDYTPIQVFRLGKTCIGFPSVARLTFQGGLS